MVDAVKKLIDIFKTSRAESLERDEKLAQNLIQVMRQQALSGQIRELEQRKQILTGALQQAAAYTNLVTLAGYAGVFAIWQLTREHLSADTTYGVAALLVTSIVIFVSWELIKMIRTALHTRRLAKIIGPGFPGNSVEAWHLAWADQYDVEARLWPYFLVSTVVTGFAAALWLLCAFLIGLASSL